MKILEINKFNFPNGGADRHFLDLTELLRQKNHEVAVFAMDHSKNRYSPWAKYFVSFVGFQKNDSDLWQKFKGLWRMFYSFEARRKIKKLLDEFEPDIVHIHNIYNQISPSILSAIKKRNIPIIMTVHDYSLVCPDYLMNCNGQDWESLKKEGWLSFVRHRCFKNSYLKSFLAMLVYKFHAYFDMYDKYIDLYLAPSDFAKDKLVKNGLRGRKIRVLPHFYAAKSQEKEPVNMDKKFVLYAGRVSEDKGIQNLINIFKKIGGASLYLAGNIEEGFNIEKSDRVKYLGFLGQEELLAYIRNSMFVVSPSKLPETFGLVALEALANGKPFIGYNAGAYGEIIENGFTGYICRDETEMEEKIKMLLADEDLRTAFSKKALERAKSFGSSRYCERIISVFQAYLYHHDTI